MLETRNSGSTNPSSALIALKPRQVLLAEHNKKTEMTATPTTKKKQNNTLTLETEQKTLLLHSVLRYLERNGFSKTLKRFLSEAQIENDEWKASSLDLEDLYCKYLDTCTYTDTNFNTYKDLELLTHTTTKKVGIGNCAAVEEITKRKKKKRSDESDSNAAADQSATDRKLAESKNSKEVLASDMDTLKKCTESEGKSKEKKTKKSSDFPSQTVQIKLDSLKKFVDDTVCELQLDEMTKQHKDKKKKEGTFISESSTGNAGQENLESLPGVSEKKFKDLASSVCNTKIDSGAEVKPKEKKKKNKPTADSLVENVEHCGFANKQGMLTDKFVSDPELGNTLDIPLEEKKVKSKEKKGNKAVSVSGRLSGEVVEDAIKAYSENECFQPSEDAIKKGKKSSKKRKRLASDENDQLVEKEAIEESKCRKTEGLEEAKNEDQLTKSDGGKESKQENGQGGQNEHNETSMQQCGGHANGNIEKNGGEKTYINQLNEHTNGNLGKNGENSAVKKSVRKQCNGSAEPKTVNAFQRVKINDVEFADEKLQDNSYWAKDGAELGYGAKAQEILGQVRGRDFRHEKTKKKRGSYRGGQIDLHSHSIKFNYSDED